MSAFQIYDKESHLKRAQDFLKSDSEADHVYACLELRFCIEAIVYQTLLHGIKNIPKNIIEKWQPDKALKMLVEIDQFAEGKLTVSVSLSKGPTPPVNGWMHLGERKMPTVKWLSDNYHGLGNYLHSREPSKVSIPRKKTAKEKVNSIAKDLEGLISGNLLIFTKNNDIRISSCLLLPGCKGEFFFNAATIKSGDEIICQKCRSTFIAKRENKITFSCKVYDIECHSCKKMQEIEDDKIKSLKGFTCKYCQSKHIVRVDYSLALSKNS
jgi:DNA-directed RNA polymerase subunit RPC12/RpoP